MQKSTLKKISIIFIFFFINHNLISSSYWQQKVKYKIDIDFNVNNNQFSGIEEVIYYNNSKDTLNKVFFHLYFNAFQPNSMMDVRSRNINDPDKRIMDRIFNLKNDEIGFHRIISFKQNDNNLSFNIEGTVLEVELHKPLYPNDSTIFNLKFYSQVPKQIRRSGRDNKEGIEYSMAQWFPKIAEYDHQGWHAHPYVAREFYAPWGDFDVIIKINKEYVVAASGILQKKETQNNNNVWNFIAKNVHDFVWAADPDYKHDKIQVPDGPLLSFYYQNNSISMIENWERLQVETVKAFQYFNKTFGKYPYPVYSIIQAGDGGMEYPMATLITGNRKLKSLVGVCVHEAMHSWYQGMLATNESLFSWMDEGFTTYASNRIEQQLFPEDWKDVHGSSYKGYKRIANSKYEEPLCTHADHFNTNWAYGTASYSKGVVILDQLSHIVGQDVVDSSLLRYFKEWSFKHPTASDFKRIVERESGIELDWYFDYFVNTTKTIDYAIEEVAKTENGTNVVLKKGEMPMPIELEVQLKDGTKLNYYIPTVLMRGEKALDTEIVQLRDWAWTNPYYVISIKNEVQDIEAITLHPNNKSIADIERLNDRLLMPEKWNWDKYNLMLNIVSRNKKGKRQKLKKIKK